MQGYLVAFLLSRHNSIWILKLFDYTLARGLVLWRAIPIRRVKPARSVVFQIGGAVMAIEGVSDDILVITLPEHPQNGNEINLANKMLSEAVDRDVVMDFGKVKMLTSATLCGLMILDRLLRGAGRQFVLCNAPPAIKHVFARTGLLTVFEFSDDQHVALQEVRSRRMSWAGT